MSVCYHCCVGCEQYDACPTPPAQGGCERCKHYNYGECTHPEVGIIKKLKTPDKETKKISTLLEIGR